MYKLDNSDFICIFAREIERNINVNQADMTKTIELLIEKSRTLAKGLRRHVSEMGERGVTSAEIEQLEQTLSMLEQQSSDVDKYRAELANKVRLQNDTMSSIKTSYAELKKTLKGFYPQERWVDYGIPDRR